MPDDDPSARVRRLSVLDAQASGSVMRPTVLDIGATCEANRMTAAVAYVVTTTSTPPTASP